MLCIMELRQYENVLRVGLLVFNITFGILSISLIALGAAYTNELWWPRNYTGLDFMKLPTLLMLLGSLSLMLSVAGCVCAKSYNRRRLRIFIILLSLVLSLELTISVICFKNMDRREVNRTRKLMNEEALGLIGTGEPTLTKLEQHYKCCAKGPEDDMCSSFVLVNGVRTKQDCGFIVNRDTTRKASYLGFFSLGLAILQMIQIIFAYLLQFSMKGLEKL